jgi:hypothetical protein
VASYTYKSARSAGLIFGIGLVLAVETTALHALLVGQYPWVAWTLTLSSLSALGWIIAHYRAMGRGAIETTTTHVDMRIGNAISVALARSNIGTAIRPTFRDLPAVGTNQGADFINLTKSSQPNVLLTLHDPVVVSMAGFKRRARRIAMHLDDPDAFLAELR